MTTDCGPRRLTRGTLCKQSVRISVRGREPTRGRGRLHGQVALDTIFRDVLTGQRISDLTKVDGSGEGLDIPKTQETPNPETPDEPRAAAEPETAEEPETPAEPETPDEPEAAEEPEIPGEPEAVEEIPAPQDEQAPPKARKGLSRRRALTVLGIGAGALIAEQALVADGIPPTTGSGFPAVEARSAPPEPGGYAPDGTAGRAAAVPLDAVELLDSPFRQNQARNTTYLLFLDPERMLRSFRLNYGEPTTAEPLGGWEKPDSQIRGHMTGHLLSGLALTYANTGDGDAKSRGQYLVSQLAAFQAQQCSPVVIMAS